MSQDSCTVEGCGKRVINKRRGLCGTHYYRWRKHGDPLAGRPSPTSREGACCVDGCEHPIRNRGLCETHYRRWWRYGDPLATPRKLPAHGTRAMYSRGCRCDACKAANSTYKVSRRDKDREAAAAYFRAWHLKNKDRRNAKRLQQYRENREQELAKNRKYLYGLTEGTYAALLAEHGGACAICRTIPPPEGKRLYVDHDHACCPGKRSCGKCIRGLLCQKCNHAVGLMRDNPALLRTAAAYLEKLQHTRRYASLHLM